MPSPVPLRVARRSGSERYGMPATWAPVTSHGSADPRIHEERVGARECDGAEGAGAAAGGSMHGERGARVAPVQEVQILPVWPSSTYTW